MAITAPHGGEGSDACAHGRDMALSAAAHHSYDKVAAGAMYDGLRAQKTDRAGEAAHPAPRRQRTRAAGEAVIFELFDEDTAGVRPGVLAEPRPQERVQGRNCSPSRAHHGALVPCPWLPRLLRQCWRWIPRMRTLTAGGTSLAASG